MVRASLVRPDLGPPVTREESDGDAGPLPSGGATAARQAGGARITARLADAPVELEPIACLDVEVFQQVYGACFADDAWRSNPAAPNRSSGGLAEEDSGPTTDAGGAVALAVVLGGWMGVYKGEPRSRTRWSIRT
jgi:hypothetical protein